MLSTPLAPLIGRKLVMLFQWLRMLNIRRATAMQHAWYTMGFRSTLITRYFSHNHGLTRILSHYLFSFRLLTLSCFVMGCFSVQTCLNPFSTKPARLSILRNCQYAFWSLGVQAKVIISLLLSEGIIAKLFDLCWITKPCFSAALNNCRILLSWKRFIILFSFF